MLTRFFTKHWPFLLGLILSLSLLWPLLAAPFFTTLDDVQPIRIFEMDKCIKDFQIPCRLVPDLGNMYGYPLFNYLPPLPYYFGEIIFLLTNNLILSVKIMFAVAFIGSYFFMYHLGKKFWGELGGSLSAIFYVFAPYHAVDFYVKGSMGEMWALMFFPALFWSLAKLEEKTNISNLLLVSIFISLLLSSHNLSAFIFIPFSLIWVLILFLRRKIVKFIYFAILSFGLGILLASFYLMPMIFEKNLVHIDSAIVGNFSYTENFKGFKKLLWERSWGYGPSVREIPGGMEDKLSYQVGWVHLLGLFYAIIAAKALWNNSLPWSKNRWISLAIIFSALSVIFSIYIINPRSIFIWLLIEPLKYLQFPWRFLILVTFFISFASGSLFLIKDINKKVFIWILLIVAVVIANISYFKPQNFLQVSDKDLLSGDNWERQVKTNIFDYLPASASEPPTELANESYKIIVGETYVSDFQEGSNWLKFKADTKSHTIIRLSQFYFPNWQIFVDGQEAKVEYKNNSFGLMTLILGEGEHIIEGRLNDTELRKISNSITIFGVGIFLTLFIIQFKRVRTWLTYYRKAIN